MYVYLFKVLYVFPNMNTQVTLCKKYKGTSVSDVYKVNNANNRNSVYNPLLNIGIYTT